MYDIESLEKLVYTKVMIFLETSQGYILMRFTGRLLKGALPRTYHVMLPNADFFYIKDEFMTITSIEPHQYNSNMTVIKVQIKSDDKIKND